MGVSKINITQTLSCSLAKNIFFKCVLIVLFLDVFLKLMSLSLLFVIYLGLERRS